MNNVFYYWSVKTKEDKKVIHLLHREVKLDEYIYITSYYYISYHMHYIIKIDLICCGCGK